MIKKILVFAVLVISVGINQSFSQCSMYEVPLTQRTGSASAIFEGKVLSKTSFWNNEHTLIFTSNSIDVYKKFKGNLISSQIELITEGGTIADKKHVVEPSLQLQEGEIGIFFVEPSTISDPNTPLSNTPFMAYASSQGFVKYNLNDGSANDPFKKYTNIETDLYGFLQQQIQHSYVIVQPFDVNDSRNNLDENKSITTAPTITSFTPTSITAGTASTLTINGTGFGATQGTSTVNFENADDGGSTYIHPAPSQYVLWSDTQIKVKVPSKTGISGNAGTGTIQVTVGSSTATSSNPLTINYAELNLDNSGTIYKTDHVNQNTTGGYTWQMYTGFDAMPAPKAAFLRAFGTWRCNTYINWQIGSTTSVNTIGSDGTNVIRMDIGSELPVGVLGRCSSYWSSCNTGVWYVSELDIVFDDAQTWNYSTGAPTGSQYDFESVALHELGHGHQLNHVINTNDVMHYAISNATSRRTLNTDDLAAGNDVMSRNLVSNTCGPTHMIALTAGNCAIGAPTADFTATPTSSCSAPVTVTFTDQSAGSPTTWTWDINNDGTTDYTTQNPTHTYATAGTYAVKLTVSNSNGSNSITKTGYITIGSATLPFTENFELPTFPPAGWSITQSPVDAQTWVRNTTATGNGVSTACASMAYFNYTSPTGQKDNLISKPVSLIGVTSATMTFKVAYKNYPNPGNYDSLRVYVSTNCGSTYGAAVYTKGGTSLATSGSLSTEFTPSVAGDWRTETVVLNSFVGNNIVVKFEGTDRWGNDLYIDDINITGATTAQPVANFTASDTTLCVGQCISFTDQSTNSPTGWAWTFTGAATTASAIQNPTNICYNTPGTYAVSLVANNGGGSNTKTKTGYIVVTALPTTPTINQTGNILTSSIATAYQWKLNGSPISGATSQTTTAAVSGSYSVTVTNSAGCSATSNPITVTLQPVAKFIASDSTVCVGQCISFTDQSTNTPTTWTWAFTGATTTASSIQNPTNICYSTPGNYTVSLVAQNGGGSNTKTKTNYITVTALPTVPTITQVGNTLTSSAATSYQWNLNGSPISGATSQTKTATVSGSYSVTITNSAGCSSTSTALAVTITGIDNLTDEGTVVVIYPNPFSSSATISIQTTNTALQSSELNFVLYDLVGKEVVRKTNMNEQTPLFREQLADGLYFYKVFYKQNLIGKGKVIIQ
jgi:PKD repeat protein